MIDERQEEFASLYALELLEAGERALFEARLASDTDLEALVRSLRDTSAALVHLAPTATPPASLKARVMESVAAPSSMVAPTGRVVRPPLSRFRQVVPWAAAACFALAGAWLGQHYLTARSEADALRSETRLAEIALKSALQQLEAERIITAHQRQDIARQLADAKTELESSRTRLSELERLLAESNTQLADRDRVVADRERLLTEARAQAADHEQRVVELGRRLAVHADNTADLNRQLGEAERHIVKLTSDLKTHGDLAGCKITTLASMLKTSPQAVAVAIWNPARQEGVLKVEKLPALKPNQDYQLWVVDPQYPNPVDGGVFSVEPATGAAHMAIKARQPVGVVKAFAVTLERKGGVAKAEGPFVLLSR